MTSFDSSSKVQEILGTQLPCAIPSAVLVKKYEFCVQGPTYSSEQIAVYSWSASKITKPNDTYC